MSLLNFVSLTDETSYLRLGVCDCSACCPPPLGRLLQVNRALRFNMLLLTASEAIPGERSIIIPGMRLGWGTTPIPTL